MALNQGNSALSTQSSGTVHSRSLLYFMAGRTNPWSIHAWSLACMPATGYKNWQMTKNSLGKGINISIEGKKQINPQTHSWTDDLINANIKQRLKLFHRKNKILTSKCHWRHSRLVPEASSEKNEQMPWIIRLWIKDCGSFIWASSHLISSILPALLLAKQYASPEWVWEVRTLENIHETYERRHSDTAWLIVPGSAERLTDTECTWATENKPLPHTFGNMFLWQSKSRLAVLAIQHTCTETNTSYIIKCTYVASAVSHQK